MQTLGGRQFWGDVAHFRGWRIQRNVFTGHYRLLDGGDRRHASGSLELCQAALEQVRRQAAPPHVVRGVLLVHGILRSSKSLSRLGKHLSEAGWPVVPFDYPSSQISVLEAAEYLHSVVRSLDEYAELNFVCHSLGGLVLRAWSAAHDDSRVKRAVLLGTPNRGAEMADLLRKNFLFRAVFGPAGQELVTDPQGLIPQLPPPKCEFGIIAGARGTPDGWNPLIPGDDDGTVSVDSTRLDGAADFLTVRALHLGLLYSEEVARQVVAFLESGRFAIAPSPG
uniref:Alpha/beta fold hydrolase n=1 Tax=Schlesneria paludicola TaxID=360056 RepID=A0A7C4QKE7_9PLAN